MRNGARTESHLAFVSTSRDHKERTASASQILPTGEVRDVLKETVSTFFESGNDAINWRYLSASNEFLWFSERSGWGHLYCCTDRQPGSSADAVT